MEVNSGIYSTELTSGEVNIFLLGTDTKGNNCFSICPIIEYSVDMVNFSFECSEIGKNATYLKESVCTVMHECQKVNSSGYLLFIVQSVHRYSAIYL